MVHPATLLASDDPDENLLKVKPNDGKGAVHKNETPNIGCKQKLAKRKGKSEQVRAAHQGLHPHKVNNFFGRGLLINRNFSSVQKGRTHATDYSTTCTSNWVPFQVRKQRVFVLCSSTL